MLSRSAYRSGRSRIGIIVFLLGRIDERGLDRQEPNRFPRGCEMFDVAE